MISALVCDVLQGPGAADGPRETKGLILVAGIGLLVVACGSDKPSSTADRAEVARQYALATVEEHNRNKALDLSPGRESEI